MSGYDAAILSWREELAKKGAHREDYTAVRRRGRQAASYWKRRNERMRDDEGKTKGRTRRNGELRILTAKARITAILRAEVAVRAVQRGT